MIRILTFLFAAFMLTAKEPFRPNLGPDVATVTVTCGDVTLLLRQASQWTPGRIDYRGSAMTTERSAYGTVFSFPGVGFIGTAHLENEPEELQSLRFLLDGKPVVTPPGTLQGKHFRLERESRIRGFRLESLTEIKNNLLHETAVVRTSEAVPLQLVYHFMHAWKPTVSAFLAGRDDRPEEKIGGPLDDGTETARKFFINQKVDWMAVYEPGSSQFAVSRLLEAPEQGAHISMIWNVPGSYRKYYLKCFDKDTVPAGFTGTWRMVTGFGASPPEKWEAEARAMAQRLRMEAK